MRWTCSCVPAALPHNSFDPRWCTSAVRPLAAAGKVTENYYGLPLLKPPVWTWEVPAYFFVGGTAGAAAVLAAVARAAGAAPPLVTHARWIAVTGAALSPPLLISDLGRPERFLNMLRVVKLQSPMSVGAWTLVAFSPAAAIAALADLASRTSATHTVTVRFVGDAAAVASAATGLVLATYTGVLIGATAIPVWSRSAGVLPLHFGVSALGAAVSLLEVFGHRDRALRRLAVGAAAVETAVAAGLEARRDPAFEALRRGQAGRLTRTGAVLTGPLPLALRVLVRHSARARQLAAFLTVIGSALTRAGWIAAGRAPARP
jgi:hypothetical protein